MKPDDTSLDDSQYQTVSEAARKLLDRGNGWGRLPTPFDDLLLAANLRVAPVSAFDEGAMLRYLREAGHQAERLLKRVIEKIRAVFDVHANTVHIDPSMSTEKQNFLKLHETGHKELPHQRSMFRWIQDCDRHLAPETADLFEREANTFASIVLFQDGAFSRITADSAFGIKVPIKASRLFGASVYAGIREYIRRNKQVCAVLILEPTVIENAIGPVAVVRRIERSASFALRFGDYPFPKQLTLVDSLIACVPFEPRRMSSPRAFALTDRNGERHEFVGEGFRTPYNTFVLIHAKLGLSSRVLMSSCG